MGQPVAKIAQAFGMQVRALRRMGLNDADLPIKRAVAYLVKTQQKDGGWYHCKTWIARQFFF